MKALALLLALALALTACDAEGVAEPDATPRLVVWECPCAATCSGVTATWYPPRVCIAEALADTDAEAEGERQCLGELAKRGCGAAACACSCSLTDPVATCSP